MVPTRVRLLLSDGHSCYRPRRTGERKRKSVRGCIVGTDLSVIALSIMKKGEGEIPGLSDTVNPKRLGPKRATKIRRFFGLDKKDDVRYVTLFPPSKISLSIPDLNRTRRMHRSPRVLTLRQEIRDPTRSPAQERRRQAVHQGTQDPTTGDSAANAAQATPHCSEAETGRSRQGRCQRVCTASGQAGPRGERKEGGTAQTTGVVDAEGVMGLARVGFPSVFSFSCFLIPDGALDPAQGGRDRRHLLLSSARDPVTLGVMRCHKICSRVTLQPILMQIAFMNQAAAND